MMVHRCLVLFGLSLLLLGTAWLRIQSVPQLRGSYLLGNDLARFLRQAEYIAQHGSLPERDMEHWLPVERDLTTYLSLSSMNLHYTVT
jgi:hypothetical protein